MLGKGEQTGEQSSLILVDHRIKQQITKLLRQANLPVKLSDPEDERWYWVAPLLLDGHCHGQLAETWLFNQEAKQSWKNLLMSGSEERRTTRFTEHVWYARDIYRNPNKLGRRPK